MPESPRPAYTGPALFSLGFRPFFAMAIAFGALVVPVWIGIYSYGWKLSGPFAPVDWHIHEMLFGYAAAVITGFLFTAIPNWTGRLPIRGWPLASLVGLWLAGRLAMAGGGGLGPVAVMVIDSSFLAAIGLFLLREIVAGRNWRNLKVVVPVLLFLAANLLFHVEVMVQGSADLGRRLSLAVVIFLITLIGGRVIPSFTRNWLAKNRPGALPKAFNRFDALCLSVGGAALVAWSVAPMADLSGWALIAAGLFHAARLSRWRGERTLRSPLLLMMHVAYGFVPLGMYVVGIGAQTAGVHLLGIGAIGGMTLAVMMRATLGHTGRELASDLRLTLAFVFVVLAALVRSSAPEISFGGISGLIVAATLWSAGFGLALWRMGPWLWSPRSAPRGPSNRSR